MDTYKLSVAGINVSEGISRFGGISSLYEKHLNKFPEDVNFRELEAALLKKDVKAAFTYCHSLKGIAGNLSIKNLYDAVCPLTEVLRSGSLDHADELFEKVKTEYNHTVAAISEH